MTAHTISVVPQITSTSPTSSHPATSCSPIASIVPPSSTQPGRPRHLGERLARSARCSASGRAARRSSASFASSHCFQSNSGNAVAATVVEIDRLARQRVIRDRLRHPVAARVGVLVRLPAQELRELARFGDRRRVDRRGRARRRRAARARTARRRRRRRSATAPSPRPTRRAARTSPSASSARCGPVVPRLRGVVLEPQRRRNEELVRDARPGDDVAVGVGRDRLHRRRSDVDPDRELRHGGRHYAERRR